MRTPRARIIARWTPPLRHASLTRWQIGNRLVIALIVLAIGVGLGAAIHRQMHPPLPALRGSAPAALRDLSPEPRVQVPTRREIL